jgi:holo-[acyl-carrier protein] synthase
MIVGIGVDLVNVPRFTASLGSISGLRSLYFAPEELTTQDGQPRSPGSLAARFAAKEAVSKALGLPAGTKHIDCRVVAGSAGEPELVVSGSVASAAERIGVTRWHVSLSLEGDVAIALVIAERDEGREAA